MDLSTVACQMASLMTRTHVCVSIDVDTGSEEEAEHHRYR